MYSKKLSEVALSTIGPSFEDLSNEEINLIDGGDGGAVGASVALSKASVAASAWSSIPCVVSATIVSVIGTVSYIIIKK